MTRTRMILGYCAAVVLMLGIAGQGRSGDHGSPDGCKTVCTAVPEQKKVTTKTYSSKTEEFCLTPLRSLFSPFGGQPQCGPVRTKRTLVVHTHTHEEPSTKYIPVVDCPQPYCPPAGAVQPAPGVAPPPPGAPQPLPGAVPPAIPPIAAGPVPAGQPVR